MAISHAHGLLGILPASLIALAECVRKRAEKSEQENAALRRECDLHLTEVKKLQAIVSEGDVENNSATERVSALTEALRKVVAFLRELADDETHRTNDLIIEAEALLAEETKL